MAAPSTLDRGCSPWQKSHNHDFLHDLKTKTVQQRIKKTLQVRQSLTKKVDFFWLTSLWSWIPPLKKDMLFADLNHKKKSKLRIHTKCIPFQSHLFNEAPWVFGIQISILKNHQHDATIFTSRIGKTHHIVQVSQISPSVSKNTSPKMTRKKNVQWGRGLKI